MLYQLRDRWHRVRFAAACRGILATPPVVTQPGERTAVLSQLQHKDLLLYLLAMKSFARFVPIGAVFIVNDGSLSSADRSLLSHHVRGVQFFDLPQFRSAYCPRGGTWERLLAIAELVKRDYVIQLDSDTLSIADLSEVAQCIAENRSFSIGTWDNQRIETMAERAAHARALQHGAGAHVQTVAEENFDKLRNAERLKYVRGCSGFTGFARAAFTREFVEDISSQMTAVIGTRWSEWGSEQVMSNIAVANAPDACVLPHPKYADCRKMLSGRTAFIHFIGSCRFSGGTYSRLGRKVIEELGHYK